MYDPTFAVKRIDLNQVMGSKGKMYETIAMHKRKLRGNGLSGLVGPSAIQQKLMKPVKGKDLREALLADGGDAAGDSLQNSKLEIRNSKFEITNYKLQMTNNK